MNVRTRVVDGARIGIGLVECWKEMTKNVGSRRRQVRMVDGAVDGAHADVWFLYDLANIFSINSRWNVWQ
jgi:hypothetical protein